MDNHRNGAVDVQQRVTGNPWSAFVPHWSLEGYKDPPTDSLTLQTAQSGWKRMFGDRQVSLGTRDPVPFAQGAILGKGGLGVVYETNIDGVAVAWKRTYIRRITERDLNEIKILAQISEERHKHIIKLIGSYTHRQRSTHEIAILTWPVARCDLSVLLHEIDLIDAWKSRDQPLDENDWSTPPTNEEKDAYDNLLKLEQLDQERSRVFTWHLREKVRSATARRLTRSIGCIAEAVSYLHMNGIRHKDIKPSQILLSSQGLWLTDFGMSKDISHLTSSETSDGERATARYHAPERERRETCGRPEDIFALGCTYLEMAYRMYGVNVKECLNPEGAAMWSFQANLDLIDLWLWPLRSSGKGSRAALSRIIQKMMAKDPGNRLSIYDVLLVLPLPSEGDDFFYGSCCKPALEEIINEDLDLDDAAWDAYDPDEGSFTLRRFLETGISPNATAFARRRPIPVQEEDEGWFSRDYDSDMNNFIDEDSSMNDFIDGDNSPRDEKSSSTTSSRNAEIFLPAHSRRGSLVSVSRLTDTLPLLDRTGLPGPALAQQKSEVSEEERGWLEGADTDEDFNLSSDERSLRGFPQPALPSDHRPRTQRIQSSN